MVALKNQIPPFPFKVAKALDPTIYRNVEYDIWNETEKGTEPMLILVGTTAGVLLEVL